MGKKAALILTIAIFALAILPAMASASLTNEYGMNFAGQSTCVLCHGAAKADTLHARFATEGVSPGAPAGWTMFRAAGDAPEVAGTGQSVWAGGGHYSIAGLDWITLGDATGNSATEYLFFRGSKDPTVMPWNLVEGLMWEPSGVWEIAAGAEEEGLLDVSYSCQRCHQLGSTVPNLGYVSGSTGTEAIPNPAAIKTASPGTAVQWARESTATVSDFMNDPAVSAPGLGIQCENCHGTGTKTDTGHGGFYTGTDTSTTLEVLGQSQVCGQCHGSYTNMAGTLGIYGYTANLPLRDFVNVDGVPKGSYSYTKIPTEAEFLAEPTKYWMFPNGSNAKGNHYYYDEWSASGHSYRGALTATDPDAMTFQAAGNGHYNAKTSSLGCAQCHTGENYLKSKGAKIAGSFTPANDNVGFMGQECITCHNGHPSAIGAEDVVRDPDPAGQRSARGLTVGNSSICEDCHNWQYEVLGGAPDYKPQASLASRGGASHPQRETLHGRVMVDVASVGEFMLDAKCEDCHMPKTNKAVTRISHGMKPMLPGDAKTWMTAAGPSYLGEDSCSTCHTSRTRDQLQANIDGWQDDTQAKADEAAAAITAAQALAPAEYSLTDPNKPGYVLVGRATWNYKAFVNDASTGVHNPMYIQAGLEKATKMAKSVGGSFSALQAPASVVPGGKGFVSGKAMNGDGSGAAGAKLELLADGVATGDITTADARGVFAFAIEPAAATTYSVVWVRSGNSLTDLSSSSMKVAIAKSSSKTTIAASASSIKVGKTVKLSGKVTPAAAGQTVKIEYRKGDGSWKTMGSVTLNASSAYAKSYTLQSKATWSFRAKYSGTTTVASSTSATVKVQVK